jgi:phospholipid transport system substrate-binding protein
MRLFHCLIVVFVALAASAGTAEASARGERAEAFIVDLSDRALALVTDKTLSDDETRKQFRDILETRFDTEWIGQFVLARYWNLATPEQRTEYLSLFSDIIVYTYTRRFDDYEGQELRVLGHQDEGKSYVFVTTQIFTPNTQSTPVNLVWRLIPANDSFRIVDVVIEGVSMGLTQRNEYASVIQRNGGKVEALLEAMRENVAKLKAQG